MSLYKEFTDKVYSCLSTASMLWPFRPGYEPTDPRDVQAFQAVTIDKLGNLGRELAEIDSSGMDLRDFLGHYQPPPRLSHHEDAILSARSAYRSAMEAAYGIVQPPHGRGIPRLLPQDTSDYAERVVTNWPVVVAALKTIRLVNLSELRSDLDDESVRAERAHNAQAIEANPDAPPAQAASAEMVGRVLLLCGDGRGFEIFRVARDQSKSVNERMTAIVQLDSRYDGFNSKKWAELMAVTAGAVRQAPFWIARKDRKEWGSE
ncbi:MAG: hypothetical protein ABSG53_33545 [Thermoguttaceae bacterium]|jgi:hypothetical protein